MRRHTSTSTGLLLRYCLAALLAARAYGLRPHLTCSAQQHPLSHAQQPLPRRALLAGALLPPLLSSAASLAPRSARAAEAQPKKRRLSLEEAREVGEARFEELEREKGPIFKVQGIKVREERQGSGAPLHEGDVAYIQYGVFRINGDYMFSVGRGAALEKEESDQQYRMVYGAGQVPKAVEMGMSGMREGGRRRIVVPPNLSWNTSGGQPEPNSFSGRRKLALYGEQPLLVEVDLQRVVPRKSVAAGGDTQPQQ